MSYKRGIDNIKEGACPLGETVPSACMDCPYGHITECHYPKSCEECRCGHWKQEHEGVPFIG